MPPVCAGAPVHYEQTALLKRTQVMPCFLCHGQRGDELRVVVQPHAGE
jgi:hypothetical protein